MIMIPKNGIQPPYYLGKRLFGIGACDVTQLHSHITGMGAPYQKMTLNWGKKCYFVIKISNSLTK